MTTGAGVPVAWHSSSKGLLTITVLCVMRSAPSIKGGTRREKYFTMSLYMTVEWVSYLQLLGSLTEHCKMVTSNQMIRKELKRVRNLVCGSTHALQMSFSHRER